MAAGVRAGIADKSVMHAISSAMEKTIAATANKTNRAAGDSTSNHLIDTVFFSEVASNHLGATDCTLDAVLECSSRDVPSSSNSHGDKSAWEVPHFVHDTS